MSKSGISQDRFMEVMKEDMQRVNVTEEDARDRGGMKARICCGDP